MITAHMKKLLRKGSFTPDFALAAGALPSAFAKLAPSEHERALKAVRCPKTAPERRVAAGAKRKAARASQKASRRGNR